MVGGSPICGTPHMKLWGKHHPPHPCVPGADHPVWGKFRSWDWDQKKNTPIKLPCCIPHDLQASNFTIHFGGSVVLPAENVRYDPFQHSLVTKQFWKNGSGTVRYSTGCEGVLTPLLNKPMGSWDVGNPQLNDGFNGKSSINGGAPS